MKKNMNIWLYVLEAVVVVIVVFYLAFTKVMPEYQKSLGSSERLFKISNYETGVEVKITQGPSFFLVITKNNEVSNIFIENELAGVIVNQNIEGKTIEKAIPQIIEILINANLINNQIINVINYNNQEVYKNVLQLMKNTLEINQKTSQIIESNSTLQQKAIELNLQEKEDNQILWTLYLNSANKISSLPKKTSTITSTSKINKESAEKYADEIYQKLITYTMNANIENQEINNERVPIQYIPGDTSNTVYASSDSWYYIKNHKVYAQITITGEKNYTFCYTGSIKDKKEGDCS